MKSIQSTALLMILPSLMYAQDIKIVGSIDMPIPQSKYSLANNELAYSIKHIHLLKLQLSTKAKHSLEQRLNNELNDTKLMQSTTAGKNVQLGMGNVPVLDQGPFGTCVTFAVTAAIDAVFSKGDYLSQLCSLQLGRYLENTAYAPSGWEGSWANIVVSQFNTFGFVSKDNEHKVGCGGVTKYPLNALSNPPGTEMTPESYHAISEPIANNDLNGPSVYWTSILDIYQAFMDRPNMDQVLNQVKASLDNKDRLTFGVVLPGVYMGLAGAVGKYHQSKDTWVLTPEIIQAADSDEDLPGHEMVITGYNDDAVAIDNHGVSHKGLLTLRNSWGNMVADKGDFYMSYAYFKSLVVEVQRVRAVTE